MFWMPAEAKLSPHVLMNALHSACCCRHYRVNQALQEQWILSRCAGLGGHFEPTLLFAIRSDATRVLEAHPLFPDAVTVVESLNQKTRKTPFIFG
jgi:hypothetical protein